MRTVLRCHVVLLVFFMERWSTSRGLQTGPVCGHPVVLTAQAYYFNHHITSLVENKGDRHDDINTLLQFKASLSRLKLLLLLRLYRDEHIIRS